MAFLPWHLAFVPSKNGQHQRPSGLAPKMMKFQAWCHQIMYSILRKQTHIYIGSGLILVPRHYADVPFCQSPSVISVLPVIEAQLALLVLADRSGRECATLIR